MRSRVSRRARRGFRPGWGLQSAPRSQDSPASQATCQFFHVGVRCCDDSACTPAWALSPVLAVTGGKRDPRVGIGTPQSEASPPPARSRSVTDDCSTFENLHGLIPLPTLRFCCLR